MGEPGPPLKNSKNNLKCPNAGTVMLVASAWYYQGLYKAWFKIIVAK